MSNHSAEVAWTSSTHPEHPETYNRDHTVTLENGHALLASAAPEYFGNRQAANPETLLLAALASCHMLTFLAIAAKRGYPVSSYHDKVVGTLEKNAEGRMAITRCVLNPRVAFADDKNPSAEELAKFHDSAHRNCFIANSLSTETEVHIEN